MLPKQHRKLKVNNILIIFQQFVKCVLNDIIFISISFLLLKCKDCWNISFGSLQLMRLQDLTFKILHHHNSLHPDDALMLFPPVCSITGIPESCATQAFCQAHKIAQELRSCRAVIGQLALIVTVYEETLTYAYINVNPASGLACAGQKCQC